MVKIARTPKCCGFLNEHSRDSNFVKAARTSIAVRVRRHAMRRLMAGSENTFGETVDERRRFVRVQVAKALVGLVIVIAFYALLGRPHVREAVALGLLVSP